MKSFSLFVVLALAIFGDVSGQQMCDQYAQLMVGNKYFIMNNRWGTSAEHCIEPLGNGFRITRQDGWNEGGAPCSYPAIVYGCHYTTCSPNTKLPLRLNQIGEIRSQLSFTYADGVYDASYDIWLDPNPNIDSNNAQEIMIWFAREGNIQPVGGQVGTVSIAGKNWSVWTGSNGSNQVVSYVSDTSRVPSFNFNVMEFINEAKNRGFFNDNWYLTSIQAGFEPWQRGVGLAVTDFSIDM